MSREGKRMDSLSVRLKLEGKEVPDRIKLGYISYPIRQYIAPPLRCYNCQRYGHTALVCKSKMRCARCGGEHEFGKCGEGVGLKCCNCGGNHNAAYGGCEVRKKAVEVQQEKTKNKGTYAEAVKAVNNRYRQSGTERLGYGKINEDTGRMDEALQVEMGEMPIHLRRKQLTLAYWVNLKGQKDSHPTKGILETCWEHGKGKVNNFGWIIKDLVQDMKLNEYSVIPALILPTIPLWILPQPKVDLLLLESRQDKNGRQLEAEMTKEYIGSKYEQYAHVFTDASKDPQKERVGVAYIIPRLKVARGERISDHVSVFTGELLAIMVAINKINEMGLSKTLICSDSSSWLEAQKSDTRQDIVLEILQIFIPLWNEMDFAVDGGAEHAATLKAQFLIVLVVVI
ncbi:uncharacterized protein LOC113093328 [Carassius auratus]|uniref:Uncharacterized protein LOC113093328 n=1 Tax=Carassius auratus TaxID=7957 RepID=A0A6P6P2C1_CARAU|nr:uncharacterized protein LOC113093328 [Carassius auratus]